MWRKATTDHHPPRLHAVMSDAQRARSLCQLLEFLRHRARAELVLRSEHPLASSLARHTAEDDAIQQGVSTEAVVAVDATRNLARGIQAGDRIAVRPAHRRVSVDLQAAHAIMDHRR